MNLQVASIIDGWIPEIELEWIAETSKISKNVLELGSFLGRSTRAICDNTDGEVTAVDLWAPNDIAWVVNWNSVYDGFCYNLKDHIDSGKLSVMRMSTDSAIDILIDSGKKFDFVFIDADHRYNQVKRDIEGCIKLLSPNGVISGHDYNWEGVKKAVDELFGTKIKLCGYIWWVEQ